MKTMNDEQKKAVEMMQQEFANLKGEVQNAFVIEQQTAESGARKRRGQRFPNLARYGERAPI